jgi:hypothetical protein
LQHQTTNNLSAPRGFSAPTTNVYNLDTRTTLSLSKGTQRKMMDAAKLADLIDTPINRLLTVRTHTMRISGGGGIFRGGTQAECVRDFLDKNYRWLNHRGLPVANIWSREFSNYHSEHFHAGYHMPPQYDASYAIQLADWLGEPLGPTDGDSATIAASDDLGWLIRGCVRGNTTGQSIAAYLGKSEPSMIVTGWGKEKKNEDKPRRSQKGGEGPIVGTSKHDYRWGTSTSLGRAQRERNGIGDH